MLWTTYHPKTPNTGDPATEGHDHAEGPDVLGIVRDEGGSCEGEAEWGEEGVSLGGRLDACADDWWR